MIDTDSWLVEHVYCLNLTIVAPSYRYSADSGKMPTFIEIFWLNFWIVGGSDTSSVFIYSLWFTTVSATQNTNVVENLFKMLKPTNQHLALLYFLYI